jgi:general secretion pathway protein J
MSVLMAKESGFTLIEMIIALVLASLLSVVIASGLHLGIRSWEAVSSKVNDGSDTYVSMHALRRVLSSLRPERVRDDDGTPQAAFYGTRNEVMFIAPLEQIGNQDDLYWIMVKERIAENGDMSLVLYLLPFNEKTQFDDDENAALKNIVWQEKIDEILQLESEIVVGNPDFSGISFEYLHIDNNGDEVWEEEWIENSQLPRSIKVTLEFGPDNVWPTMYVLPKTSAYEFKKLF